MFFNMIFLSKLIFGFFHFLYTYSSYKGKIFVAIISDMLESELGFLKILDKIQEYFFDN